MYIPPQFDQKDFEKTYDFLKKNSFGTLLSANGAEVLATHVPALVERGDGGLRFYVHVAVNNRQAALSDGSAASLLFMGPHCYISSRWYQASGTVPTWNYVSVQAHGTIRRIEDAGTVRGHLHDLVRQYDPGNENQLAEIREAKLDGMFRGIVAFELVATKIESNWKLSQHHGAERKAKVIQQLLASARDMDREIGTYMQAELDAKQAGAE